ncbi:MAG: ribonuclease III [Elainellaceae cyanobacterium]
MHLPDPRRQKQLQQLVVKLGLPDDAPIQWHLLDQALTHATFSQTRNYEQLEFVGDAVLRLVSAACLYETYPHLAEGDLSAIRAVLVSDRTLAKLADRYNLSRYLLVGASALGDKAGAQTRSAAAFEALLGSLFLSTHDLSLVRPWLNVQLQEFADTIRRDPTLENYKGALQGFTQAQYQILPDYRVTEIGHNHGDKERFLAEVWLNGKCWGAGKGQSKKAAEQEAARIAFHALQPQQS